MCGRSWSFNPPLILWPGYSSSHALTSERAPQSLPSVPLASPQVEEGIFKWVKDRTVCKDIRSLYQAGVERASGVRRKGITHGPALLFWAAVSLSCCSLFLAFSLLQVLLWGSILACRRPPRSPGGIQSMRGLGQFCYSGRVTGSHPLVLGPPCLFTSLVGEDLKDQDWVPGEEGQGGCSTHKWRLEAGGAEDVFLACKIHPDALRIWSSS